MAAIKFKARVEYVGQSERGGDRFAVINSTDNDSEIINTLLDIVAESYEFKCDGFSCGGTATYWISVDDYDDYKVFMQEWKKAKRIFKERMTFDFSK